MGTIGWGTYIIAFILMLVCAVAFVIITTILAMVPFVGWVIRLVLTPVYAIFVARYMSQVYDHGEPQPAAPVI